MSKRGQKTHDLALLGRAIRELREQRRLSQSELAAASGVDARRIPDLEAGQHDPDWLQLLAVAKALGVRPVALVTRAEELAKESVEPSDPAD